MSETITVCIENPFENRKQPIDNARSSLPNVVTSQSLCSKNLRKSTELDIIRKKIRESRGAVQLQHAIGQLEGQVRSQERFVFACSAVQQVTVTEQQFSDFAIKTIFQSVNTQKLRLSIISFSFPEKERVKRKCCFSFEQLIAFLFSTPFWDVGAKKSQKDNEV